MIGAIITPYLVPAADYLVSGLRSAIGGCDIYFYRSLAYLSTVPFVMHMVSALVFFWRYYLFVTIRLSFMILELRYNVPAAILISLHCI